MNMSGPVRVLPIILITKSNRGTISPKRTPKATMSERIKHRLRLKSKKKFYIKI